MSRVSRSRRFWPALVAVVVVVVLAYPQYLQAYNDAKWTGWTRVFNGKGPAFLTTGYPQSYIALRPVAAGVLALAVVARLLRRRRVEAEEERG